jgi:hypothetical protein
MRTPGIYEAPSNVPIEKFLTGEAVIAHKP